MRTGALVPLLALLQAQAVSAQQAPPPAAAAPAKAAWQVDWSNGHCILTRLNSGANQASFAVRLIPGATRPDLVAFVNPATTKLGELKAGKAILELQPAAFRSDVSVAPLPALSNAQLLVLGFGGLDARFLESLPKADHMSFSVGAETVSIPMKSADKAMVAFRKCVDDTLVELGFDPKQLATLRDQPQGDWQALATTQTYPPSAMRARKSGTVTFRATVDPAGHVSKCAVLQSSGTKELDDQTCTLLTSKARFKPAVAADGSTVAAPVVAAMIWQLTAARR